VAIQAWHLDCFVATLLAMTAPRLTSPLILEEQRDRLDRRRGLDRTPGTASEARARGAWAESHRLALDLGAPSGRITDILNGRRSISVDTTVRLGRYFGNALNSGSTCKSSMTSRWSSATAGKRSRVGSIPPTRLEAEPHYNPQREAIESESEYCDETS
jgi:hypothetical protein